MPLIDCAAADERVERRAKTDQSSFQFVRIGRRLSCAARPLDHGGTTIAFDSIVANATSVGGPNHDRAQEDSGGD
jgi:hypothetical protein